MSIETENQINQDNFPKRKKTIRGNHIWRVRHLCDHPVAEGGESINCVCDSDWLKHLSSSEPNFTKKSQSTVDYIAY